MNSSTSARTSITLLAFSFALLLAACHRIDRNARGATADNVSSSLSSVVASPDSGLFANGTDTSTITVTLRDAAGAGVSGVFVRITSDGVGDIIVQPASPSDANGESTGSLRSNVAGAKTLTVIADPGRTNRVLDDQPVVSFSDTTIDATNSSISTAPDFGAEADGVAPVIVTVTLRDAANIPVAGQIVEIAATGTGNTITQPAAPTDADGQANATIQSTVAEVKTISATANPGAAEIVLNDTADAEFVWDVPGEYFVRVDGSDTASGETPATAWATIGMAVSTAPPGSTVFVGAGTYTESVTINAGGTAEAPTRLIGDRSGANSGAEGDVLVDAMGNDFGFRVTGTTFVDLVGFSVTGATGAGTGGGILVDGGASNVRLIDNRLYGNTDGIQVLESSLVAIEGNRASNNDSSGIIANDSSSVSILDNLVYGNAVNGVLVRSGSTAVTLEANTIHFQGGDGVLINNSSAVSLARHNIITFNMDDGIDLRAGSTVANDFNTVFGNADTDFAGLAAGPNTLLVDPLFVDPDGADDMLGGAEGEDDQFQLDAVTPSPAIDAGFVNAAAIAHDDGTTLGDRTTRVDGVLDGQTPDGAIVNMGFHYTPDVPDLGVLMTADGRLLHGQAGGAAARARTWEGMAADWAAESSIPASGAEIRWLQHRLSPSAGDRNEYVLAFSETATGTELEAMRWSGRQWTRDWRGTAVTAANAGRRGFDMEIEDSGDVLVVFSDDTETPAFRIFSEGQWTAKASLPLNDGAGPNPDTNSGVVHWVELVPRAGTDEMALVFADANADLVAIVWDGADWVTATANTLATDVKTNPNDLLVGNRAFDAAWETSGDLLVAWGVEAIDGYAWSVKAAAGDTFTAPAMVAIYGGFVEHIELASEPSADRIAGGFYDMGNGTERIGAATWDGTTWTDIIELDISVRDSNDMEQGDFPGDVEWVGSTGTAVMVYGDEDPGTLDWVLWTESGGWVIQPDLAVAGKGETESAILRPFPGQDLLMALFSDDAGDLYGALNDGTSWTLTNSGAPLEAELSSVTSVPYDFSIED